MLNLKQNTQDILQEEILRERAAVLARTGERLEEALNKLHGLEEDLQGKLADLGRLESPVRSGARRDLINDINKTIRHFNKMREHAQVRFYYLIVTREALGMRHHQRVEEFYHIPPKKQSLQEG